VPTSIHEHSNQRSNERLSLADPKPSVAEHDRVKLSATEHDSAWFTDSTSSVLASLGCAAMLEEEALDPCSITAVRRVLGRNSDCGVPLCFPSCKHQPTDVSTTYPPDSYISHYHTSTHPLLIRPIRAPYTYHPLLVKAELFPSRRTTCRVVRTM
jgi:hypothetical protein